MRSGACSPRRESVRPTSASASSSWPTSNTKDTAGARRHGYMLKGHPGTTLTDAIQNWPTPDAAVMNDGEDLWATRRERNRARGVNGNGMGTVLAIAAQQWATPAAHERTHEPRQVDHGIQLANQASSWSTPTARDTRGSDLETREGEIGRAHV